MVTVPRGVQKKLNIDVNNKAYIDSGVARNFSQGVRNSVIVSNLQPITSSTVSGIRTIEITVYIVFIGVCTNCASYTKQNCSHNPSKDVTGQTSTLIILQIV